MSREIDALVAEKVMGITLIGKDMAAYLNEETQFMMPIPFYSTDIAAAWEVVEKVNDLGWNISFDPIPQEWITDFDEHQDWVVSNKTAPMAICLAALKAKGED